MRYDFDLFYVDSAQVPSAVRSEGDASVQKSVLGVFRDQQTVDAVAAAPPIVRLFLEEAGFGTKAPYSNDRATAASRADPVKRRALVRQLTLVLSNRAMKKALGRAANVGDFNVHDFVASVVAQPAPCATEDVPDGPPVEKVKPRRPIEVRKSGARRRVRPS